MPLSFVRQDITKMNTDAIVAAEGNDLKSHGEVGSAIAVAAGEMYQEACNKIGFCDTGDAVITEGFDLPARFVIHTVGPRFEDGHKGEALLLASCYEKCLKLAEEYGCKSIAFPVIASGGFDFPKEKALKVAAEAINDFLKNHDMDIYLVTFDKETTLLGKKIDAELQEYIDDNYVGEKNYRKRRANGWNLASFINTLPICETVAALSSVEDYAETHKAEEKHCNIHKEVLSEKRSLDDLLKIRDESFQQMLFRLIVEKDMKNAEVYTRANLSKAHFSKIKMNPEYRPKKETVFALAVALRLNLGETKELLEKAGYAISHSFVLDTIVEYFIVNRKYDITAINFALFDHDQPLLGEKAL